MLKMTAMTRILSRPAAAQFGRTCNRALWGGLDSKLKLEATKFLRSYQNLSDSDKLASLSTSSDVSAIVLCHSLSYLKGSLLLAMSLRKNALHLLRTPNVNTSERVAIDSSPNKRKFWKEIDAEVGKWLFSAFSSDMLTIKQISFTTSSGSVLEKIANGESVHPVRNLRDLKSRLKDGRRYCVIATSVLVFYTLLKTNDAESII
jgi:Malonyl-CoA decarboxylase C-terminal domain